MQCARCHAENPAGMKFCGQCAAPLASVCPLCSAANPPGNKFCGQCATPLAKATESRFESPETYTPKHLAEKILTSRSALEDERKQVTVLFAWDEEQVRLFLAEARRSSSHYRLYLMILLAGLRPGEALALRWEDVNMTLGTITVQRKFYRLGARQLWGATKTHRQYAVSIPQLLADELRALRQEQAAQRRMWGDAYEDHGLVFCQPNGLPLHERNLARRDFRRTAKHAGVPQIRLYDLRHCNATHLADQGTPVHIVQRRLGHSSPTTTLRYYTHVLADTERAAADRLADRLLGRHLDPGGSRG